MYRNIASVNGKIGREMAQCYSEFHPLNDDQADLLCLSQPLSIRRPGPNSNVEENPFLRDHIARIILGHPKSSEFP